MYQIIKMKYESLRFDKLVSLLNLGTIFPLITLFVLILASLVILQKTTRKKKYFGTQTCNKAIRGLDAIPTVKPQFPIKFIGNVSLFLPFTKAMDNLEQQSKEHGDFFKFVILNQTNVALLSAPLVQSLLKSTDYGHIAKEPIFYDPMKPFIKNGILVSNGQYWKGQRKIIMKTQHFSSLKAYMPMINRSSKQLIKELQILFSDGGSHQISEPVNTAFLKLISEMLCGHEVESKSEYVDYHHNFRIWEECLMKRILYPYLFFDPIWNLHPLSRKYGRAVDAMCAFAKRRIAEHREIRSASAGTSPPFRSVVDELIDEGVDDDQIVDEMNTLMFGGHSTGGATIQFFCYEMALNPEIQQTCQKEVDQLFEHHTQDGNLHFESVYGELKYLERCIQETLRLFPPIFMFIRKLATPLDMEHQGQTIRLPSGTSVAILPYLIHRKEEYYPDPDKFDPDRFLPEEQAKRPAYSYLPFAAGIRNCLGLKFAMLEMKAIAAYILRHFNISSTDKSGDIPLLPAITLTPQRDYMFKLEPRLT